MIIRQLRRIYQAYERENNLVFLNLLEPDPSAKVLDLGCGDGNFTLQMGIRIGGRLLYGVEGKQKAVELCEELGIKAFRLDLNNIMPFENESFDVVCASQVIEHLRYTDLLIKEIYRVLTPGGYAVISTPNFAVWHNLICILFGWQPWGTAISDEVALGNPLQVGYKQPECTPDLGFAHSRLFTLRSLKEFLMYHKFKIEKMVGVGYFPLPVTVGRILSRIDPIHSLLLTAKVRKVQAGNNLPNFSS